MRTVAIAAVLLLVGIAPAPARAGWKINRAVAVANSVWQDPCPWSIQWADPTGLNFGDDAGEPAAWASMQAACRVVGSGTVYLNETMHPHTFDVFCTRVLHEVGHLAGAVHSADERSVMYPRDRGDEGWIARHGRRVWEAGGADRRCRDRGRPYLEARGLLARAPGRRDTGACRTTAPRCRRCRSPRQPRASRGRP